LHLRIRLYSFFFRMSRKKLTFCQFRGSILKTDSFLEEEVL
jgi:hypothetical protein